MSRYGIAGIIFKFSFRSSHNLIISRLVIYKRLHFQYRQLFLFDFRSQRSLGKSTKIYCPKMNRVWDFGIQFQGETPAQRQSLSSCISHIASFRQNNLIAWKEHPRCLHLKTKRALYSLLLLLLLSPSACPAYLELSPLMITSWEEIS